MDEVYPGKVVTLFRISILNGFRKTGICPPDKTVSTDKHFLPSTTTDIQIVDSETSATQVINEEINEQNSEISEKSK